MSVIVKEDERYKATQYCTYADEGDKFTVLDKYKENGKTVVELVSVSSGRTGIISVPKYAFEKPEPEFSWLPD